MVRSARRHRCCTALQLIRCDGEGSLGTIIYHTQPFYVVLLGAIIFKDTITRHQLGWIVVAFVGLILVTHLDLATLMSANEYMSGIGYALLAAVLYAGNTISTNALKTSRRI